MDCENIKYCITHGVVLDQNGFCDKCVIEYHNYWKGREGIPPIEKTCWLPSQDYPKRLAERNRKPWHKKDYGESSYVRTVYVCDNCKIFHYHRLRWCAFCGTEFREVSDTWKNLIEKYKDYKEGG